jgi:2-keto-4-pentenoate hydratase
LVQSPLSSDEEKPQPGLEIASAFVAARQKAQALSRYPGIPPNDLATAYRVQDRAIELWPDQIAGWKVGMILGEMAQRYGANRLAGPVFSSAIQQAKAGQQVQFSIIDGGFGAVEAEVMFLLGEDAPADKLNWTAAEACELVCAVHAGIEIAGSPFAGINDFGPCVIVTDFGNNAGLIVGKPLPDWRQQLATGWVCETRIDGRLVGRGDVTGLQGGAVESLRFLLELNAARGYPLRKGQYVSSGAITGVHLILPGQAASIVFDATDAIDCLAVAAVAMQ